MIQHDGLSKTRAYVYYDEKYNRMTIKLLEKGKEKDQK